MLTLLSNVVDAIVRTLVFMPLCPSVVDAIVPGVVDAIVRALVLMPLCQGVIGFIPWVSGAGSLF